MSRKERERLLAIYNRRVKEANELHAPFLVFEDGKLLGIVDEENQNEAKLGFKASKEDSTYQERLFDNEHL